MGIVVLKYQNNFADNLSQIAYAKILESSSGRKFYFENDTKSRLVFDKVMSNFNLDIDYISKSKVDTIAKKSYLFSRNLINNNKIKRELTRKRKSDTILNAPIFKIDDIKHLSDDIINQFKFLNEDFIVDYDILEEIKSTNSVGIFISEKDIKNDDIDYDYIHKSVFRINKYIKKPKFFIFSSSKQDITLNVDNINYKILSIKDWREEFYFLTECKNKIILNSPNSYSEGFWSAVLNQKDYGIYIYDKKIKAKSAPYNWIGI